MVNCVSRIRFRPHSGSLGSMLIVMLAIAFWTTSCLYGQVRWYDQGDVRLSLGAGYFDVPNVHLGGEYRSGSFLGTNRLRGDYELGIGYGFGSAVSDERYRWEYDYLGRKH
jgi:hypothetical protein